MIPAVQFRDVTKFFRSFQALKGVSFSIESGKVHGLLGPNGAGKSTILKLMSGLLIPNSGQILIEGLDIIKGPILARGMIGLLGEHAPLYPQMTVREYLKFVANLYDIADFRLKFDELVFQLELQDFLDRPNRTLSKGQKQRVGLAQALLPDPKVLVLDEPTSGFDPQMAFEFRTIIQKLKENKKTIIFSGHILSEIESLADDITIVNKGMILESGPLEIVRQKFKTHTVFEVTTNEFSSELENKIRTKFNVEPVLVGQLGKECRWQMSFNIEKDYRLELAQFLLDQKIVPLEFKTLTPSLEQIFKEVMVHSKG